MEGKRKPVRQLAAPSLQGETTKAVGASARGPQIDYRNFTFQELDDEDDVTFDNYCGPTPESNWVIPGKILVGAYPASVDDQETFELLTSIMLLGITKFVCLQQEYRTRGVTEQMWRSGQALRPYFEDVRTIAREKDAFPMIPGIKDLSSESSYKFVHFPIRDCSVTDDDRVQALCVDLVRAVANGETLYVHCWGGHGRTGTVICIMLHLMYGLSAEESMSRCQLVHDLRQCPVVVGSPQTQTQRDQVTRVIAKLIATAHKESLKESHKTLSQTNTKIPTGVMSRVNSARVAMREGVKGFGAMTPGRHPQMKISKLPTNKAPNPSKLLAHPPVKSPAKKAVSPQALHGLYTVDENGVAKNTPSIAKNQLPAVSSSVESSAIKTVSTSKTVADPSTTDIKLPVAVSHPTQQVNGSEAMDIVESPPVPVPVPVPVLPVMTMTTSQSDRTEPVLPPMVKSSSTSKLGNGVLNRTATQLKPASDDTDKPAIEIDSLPTEVETTYSEDFDEYAPEENKNGSSNSINTKLDPKPPSQPISSGAASVRRRRMNHTVEKEETRAAAPAIG
mmetsp:Transcript_36578/g.37247  ORF Transcript_36578/g.37247 Transcript_36578/m.37247 type:complete len:562 (+) Transcript_36578:421-2106(+)|eukprot:CAMPEP_0182423220 /NCGR_PEP_ID=MMETSP1167-20130531/9139_1 /TAXON_ID=2988 /ORGANISM="Mallomonas Sp, Strain CCMP3275" /LENGTH=561 /DNA_ID=CAMNT_0024601971 /DNA_START=329 /DNA_END=2014 /DNA_ORIENTATION=-